MNATKRNGLFGVAAGLIVLLTSCTGAPQTTTRESADPLPQGDQPVELDPAQFSTTIDNELWPMVPGTRWTYREIDPTGSELTVVVTVTTATKTIANGITARVVRDTVYSGTEIVEDTFDWYAQDSEGAIWYLGEDTAEFENGVIGSREGSFEAGVDGALAGIAMPANPRTGLKYRQEYYKDQAEDNGEILSVDEIVEVPYGQFEHALLTRDTIAFEPKVLEYKFYVPGVGPVLTLDISGGSGGREELIGIQSMPEGTGTGPLGRPD